MKSAVAWTLAVLLLASGAVVAVIWAGVVARKPAQPSGTFLVASRATTLTIDLGTRETGSIRLRGDNLRRITTRVGVWLPIRLDERDPAPRDLPVIVYAPGWGDGYDDNTVLAATLASHGYAVLAIDDIARDPKAPWATADDEAARLATFDVGTAERQAQFMEDADRRVALAAAKVRAVLDAVARAQGTEPLFERLDLDRVAAIGASFGGATAMEAAIVDPRILAAVNLDGLVFGRAAAEVTGRPVLEFNSTLGVVPLTEIDSADLRRRFFARLSVQQIAREHRQLAARGDAIEVTIAGTRHSDFTDELYASSRILAWRPWRERPIRPARLRAIVDTLVLAFFDAHVRRTIDGAERLARASFPEAVIARGRGAQ